MLVSYVLVFMAIGLDVVRLLDELHGQFSKLSNKHIKIVLLCTVLIMKKKTGFDLALLLLGLLVALPSAREASLFTLQPSAILTWIYFVSNSL